MTTPKVSGSLEWYISTQPGKCRGRDARGETVAALLGVGEDGVARSVERRRDVEGPHEADCGNEDRLRREVLARAGAAT